MKVLLEIYNDEYVTKLVRGDSDPNFYESALSMD